MKAKTWSRVLVMFAVVAAAVAGTVALLTEAQALAKQLEATPLTMQAHAGEPFFIEVGFHQPHSPFQWAALVARDDLERRQALLRANARVPYAYVADVLFALQRGGLKKIGFITGTPGAVEAAPAG